MKAIIKNSIVIVLMLYCSTLYAQQPQLPPIDFKHEKFEVIKEKVENYLEQLEENNIYLNRNFINEDESEEPHIQIKRWLKETANHLDENGYVINYAAKNWEEYLKVKQAENARKGGQGNTIDASTGGSWYAKYTSAVVNGPSIGVRLANGRTNCLALDPTNANIIYAGAIEGGVWRTTDGGTNWYCITNNIPLEAVAAIAVNPSNTNNIFILTGRAGNNFIYSNAGSGFNTPSTGVLVTYDGGANWFATGLTFTQSQLIQGYDLKISPTNSNVILAATSNGIYKSLNGGSSWVIEQSGTFYSIEFKPGASTCYAGAGNDIYVSTDNGTSWTVVASGSYLNGKPTGSAIVKLAVTPNNSNYVYALFQGGSNCRMLRSFDSGSTFGEKADITSIMNYQAGYGYALAVSPNDVSTLYMGDLNYYKSTDFGATWNQVASYYQSPNVHEDAHDMICRGTSELFIACDGGVWKTSDGGTSFNFLSNSLNCAAYYGFGGYPSDPNLFVGGTWDNGHFRLSGSNLRHLSCCDQGDAMIKANNSNTVYMTTENGNCGVIRSTDAGDTWTDISASNGCGCPDASRGGSNKIIQQNPLNSNTVYSMYRDFYISYNGGTNWQRKIISTTTASQAFAQGTNDTARFYAIKGQQIWGSANNGTTWSLIYTHTYTDPIIEITVNAANKNEFYFVCSNYTAANKAWRGTWTGTGSATVTNLSTGLPNVPIYKVLYQNTSSPGIYAGTDIGIFFRSTATGNWELFSSGLPFCRVVDMEINYGSNVISCATYGRGIWQSGLYSGCPFSFNHGNYYIFGIPFASPTVMGSEYFEASDNIHSSVIIQGGIGTDVTYNSGNYVLLTDTFEVKYGSTFTARIQGCTNPIPPPALMGDYAGAMKGVDGSTIQNITSPAYDFSMQLIPNPANSYVNIMYQLKEDCITDIYLLDVTGRVAKQIQKGITDSKGPHQFTLHTNELSDGIYFVKIVYCGSAAQAKLVVTH